jgi:hypothetical protein
MIRGRKEAGMSGQRILRKVALGIVLTGLLGAAGAIPSSAQTVTPTGTPAPIVTATPTAAGTSVVAVTPTATTTTAAQQQPFLLTATLLGIAEVPVPGALTGLGSAAVLVDQGRGMVCYSLHAVNIDFPTAAHIHEGAVDAAGPVVVPFAAPTGENSTGCVANADAAVISRIMDNPSGFYVNVHTTDFPDGAVRGQLGR